MAYNADDPKQVKKARAKAELNDALTSSVIKEIMSTAAGRRWIYDWLDRCHIFGTTFIAGSPDSSAFAEGERNVGLQLLADVQKSASEFYMLMIKEAKSAS